MEVSIDFAKVSGDNYKIYIDELDTIKLPNRVAIVTNPKVSGLHIKDLLSKIEAKEIYIITLLDGEEFKNQKSIDFIHENLFNHHFDRKSTLIAFGGGVIGDMTGYAASTYQRGIDFIQIPTTLLSQVDASVGGKTGINNRYGKNLIGAFHQPKAVYIETSFLDTLASREFGAGVAEMIKMAVTFDRDFFEWLLNNDLKIRENLQYAIKRSVEIKADVVSKDEKEKGIRAVLNYGHTFAHVIENETNYKTYLHGEAVAIGINMANTLSCKLGIMSNDEAKSIKDLLQRYELPTSYDIKDPISFYQTFFHDKKTFDSKIKFILASGIGGYEMRDDIEKSVILDTLREYSGLKS
jgi:3-dehydroquinate synthase